MTHATSRLGAGLLAIAASTALAFAPTTAQAAGEPQPRDDRASSATVSAEKNLRANTPVRARGAKAPLLGKSASDSYIVVLNEGANDKELRATKSEAKGAGARVTHSYTSVIDGFAAKLTPAALRSMRANPDVAFIEPVVEMSIDATQSPATWGLDRIDQRSLPLNSSYTYNQTGAGVTAYIIDTGIRTSHSDFSGRARSGYTAINDGRGSEDCNGHGTHVAGTVGGETHGVAKDVTLVAVRVLDCNGSGSNAGVIAGVDWVTQNHAAGTPAVANMSLGGGLSSALDTAVNNSIADGVTYALAAGNDYGANACNGSPSRVANGLTVGSSTNTDARSSFSNVGSCLDIFAPGSSITSAWHTSNSATNTISGTSMATPHVAGAAALYLQTNPGASPATVSNALVSSATTGVLSNVGSGSPNRLLHVGTGGTTPDPDPEPEPTTCGSMPEVETGSLSSGGAKYHPGASGYYYSGAGTHVGCLSGPSNADFDLYLEKWNGSRWVVVARSISTGSEEEVRYTGTSGYYSWRVQSYSGSGSYTFGFDRP